MKTKTSPATRLARAFLLHFTNYSFPQYQADPAHALIASKLDDVRRGEIKRLMIFAPPQHGKSELTSVRLPALWLGNRPDDTVILTSYAADLAESKSREARNLVESVEYQRLFSIHAARDSRAVNHWKVDGHRGGMLTGGVGGPITGHGAELAIIDDPVKNWEEAYSETYRERVWDWWRSTLRTRVREGAPIVLIMCMTGETPVRMADGTERPLSEIKVGDRVATYDNGELGTSTVQNWANQGPDTIYEVRMKSGRRVRANARHPFRVIQEKGAATWVRLESLRAGMKVRSVEVPIRVSSAPPQGVEPLRSVRACACPTMARPATPQGIDRLRPAMLPDERFGSRDATVSPSRSTTGFLRNRTDGVPSVESALTRSPGPSTGPRSSASTTTTIQGSSEASCATTATSSLPERTLRPSCEQPSSIWSIGTDEIIEIVAAGIEDVFDIEVERTHNFIANGLEVSNTRWHEDDLAGRLLLDQPGEWEVLRLPALAETQDERDESARLLGLPLGQPDPLGRAPGEALCPRRFSAETLEQIKRDVGPLVWWSLYQGVPRAPGGAWFKREMFPIVEIGPVGTMRIRWWDLADSEDSGARTAGVLMTIEPPGLVYVEHAVFGQWAADKRDSVIRQTAQADGRNVQVWMEQEPGSGGKYQCEALVRQLAGYPAFYEPSTGSKDARMVPFISQARGGNVRVVRGEWNRAYIDEMCALPTGRYRDMADATSGAYNKLAAVGILRQVQVRMRSR